MFQCLRRCSTLELPRYETNRVLVKRIPAASVTFWGESYTEDTFFIQPRLALYKDHHKTCSVKSELTQKYISVRLVEEINTPFLVIIIMNHNALHACASRNGSWRRRWATEEVTLESCIYWWWLMLVVFIWLFKIHLITKWTLCGYSFGIPM